MGSIIQLWLWIHLDIKIENHKIAPILSGINEFLINKQKFIDRDLDTDKWQTENYVIIEKYRYKKSEFKTCDEIKINVKNKVK